MQPMPLLIATVCYKRAEKPTMMNMIFADGEVLGALIVAVCVLVPFLIAKQLDKREKTKT
jgi:hypothetical protein